MDIRRSHYEMAFEALLARRGIPCVPVEDVRHQTRSKTGAKIFDYIVYPSGGPACLIEVKGRKTRRCASDDEIQAKSWVTRGDLDGLSVWQEVFGGEYVAMFAFAYWLVGEEPLFPPEGEETFIFAARRYSFRLVRLDDYIRHHKQRSPKWDTVWVPSEPFRGICRSLESSWPAAPC